MSNCITIRSGGEIVFTADEFDIEGLLKLTSRVVSLDKAPDGHQDAEGYLAWWFLTSNYDPQPCTFTEERVTIKLGQGRSSHTWRDFKHTLLLCIEPFIKEGVVKKHPFTLYDEELDGCDYWTVEFGQFKEQLKREKEAFEREWEEQRKKRGPIKFTEVKPPSK